MTVSRRKFLARGAAALGSAAVVSPFALSPAQSAVAAESKPGDRPKAAAELKLASQLTVIPGKELAEKLAAMERWGFDGVELHGDVVGNEKKYQDALKNTKLQMSAVCWGSYKGDLVSEVVEKRAGAVEAFKKVIASAGALGSTGVIYVPAFNGQTQLPNQEIRKIFVDTLPALGELAVQSGTRILLEPLNRKEAYFLRQVADAAAIARDCNSPGVCVMGDFYHMHVEETSDLGAFLSAGPLLHHVHLASRMRNLPGQDERSFVEGFQGLKWIGFRDFCSFECGVRGDRTVEIPKSLTFLREQWAAA